MLYPTPPRPLACLVHPVVLYSTGQAVVPGHVMTEALHVIVSGKNLKAGLCLLLSY